MLTDKIYDLKNILKTWISSNKTIYITTNKKIILSIQWEYMQLTYKIKTANDNGYKSEISVYRTSNYRNVLCGVNATKGKDIARIESTIN